MIVQCSDCFSKLLEYKNLWHIIVINETTPLAFLQQRIGFMILPSYQFTEIRELKLILHLKLLEFIGWEGVNWSNYDWRNFPKYCLSSRSKITSQSYHKKARSFWIFLKFVQYLYLTEPILTLPKRNKILQQMYIVPDQTLKFTFILL